MKISKIADFLLAPLVFCLRALFAAYLKSAEVRKINPGFSPLVYCDEQPAVYLFWHAKNLFLIPCIRHPRFRFLTVKNFWHWLLQNIAGIADLNKLPYSIPSFAPLQIRDALAQGWSIGIPADGPYGPAGKLKNWVLPIARQAGVPIIAIEVNAEKKFRIPWRWDKLEIPFPWTRITITATLLSTDLPDEPLVKKTPQWAQLISDSTAGVSSSWGPRGRGQWADPQPSSMA